MFWIFIILGLIISIVITYQDYVWACLGGLFISLLLYGLVWIFTLASIDAEYEIKYESNLSSIILNSESSYSGSFFLIAGSFGKDDSEDKYYFMSEGDLGYKIDECAIDVAYINYVDEGFKVVVHSSKITNVNWFQRLMGFEESEWLWGDDTGSKYQFFIPKDSFVEIYDVDLNNLVED